MYLHICFLLFFFFPNVCAIAQIRNPRNISFRWKTDTTQHIIPLNELTVAVPKGTFPKIDFPSFVGKSQGRRMFLSREPVIAVEMNGRAKAYPLSMLTVHEIANDTLGDIPILVTYCPLCNSGIVYDRRLKQEGKAQVLEFEVSGMLRNSDMVMFDRQTESWWQQLLGDALVGELAGSELSVIPSLIISVEAFFESYPEGKILSKENGELRAQRQYGTNYYENYDARGALPYESFFPNEKLDHRLEAMERVIDVKGKEGYKIYPFSTIAQKGVINDQFEGKEIVIFYQEGALSVLDQKDIAQSREVGMASIFDAHIDGRLLQFRKNNGQFVDQQTGSVWNISGQCISGKLEGAQLDIEPHSNHFAFAWLAFHPDSEIFE